MTKIAKGKRITVRTTKKVDARTLMSKLVMRKKAIAKEKQNSFNNRFVSKAVSRIHSIANNPNTNHGFPFSFSYNVYNKDFINGAAMIKYPWGFKGNYQVDVKQAMKLAKSELEGLGFIVSISKTSKENGNDQSESIYCLSLKVDLPE